MKNLRLIEEWNIYGNEFQCVSIYSVKTGNNHRLGNQPWMFIARTDVEAEAPIHWPPDAKSWVIGKDADSGKDWGQEKKGAREYETVGWYHQLNDHEFE